MKQIILVTGIFISSTGFSQNLQSNPWRIDQVIGSDTSTLNEITLQKVDTTNQNWFWGNTIKFLPKDDFTCQYAGWCGNDCFRSSAGSYHLVDPSHVTIFIKEYFQKGACEQINRTIGKTIGTYLIVSIDDNTIKLVKQDE